MYSILIGIVVVIVSLIVISLYPDSTPFIFIGGMQACFTLALVWYNLFRRPDLDILGINIEPEDDRGNVVAKDNFTKPVRGMRRPVVEGEPAWKWSALKSGYKLECQKAPSKLRITFDVVNQGGSGTTVHEIRYKQHKPEEKFGEIIPLLEKGEKRKYLREGERITAGFKFPWGDANLQDGNYIFTITLITYDKEKQISLRVEISENKNVIKWWRWEIPTIRFSEWIRRRFE